MPLKPRNLVAVKKMLYLIGIGLKARHITQEALEAAKRCRLLYLDTYTSAYSEGSIADIEKMLGKKITRLGRADVEERFGGRISEAARSDIALLVFGNPLSATTHVQLLIDAKEAGVETRVVQGISIYDMLGSTGLDQYRFGRTCTIVQPTRQYAPESFYAVIEKNSSIGLHTLCLLDTRAEQGKPLSIREALEILEEIEKKRRKGRKGILAKATLVGIAGAGSSRQQLVAGSIKKLKEINFSEFPQSLIVCGSLNEKEKEALGVFASG